MCQVTDQRFELSEQWLVSGSRMGIAAERGTGARESIRSGAGGSQSGRRLRSCTGLHAREWKEAMLNPILITLPGAVW